MSADKNSLPTQPRAGPDGRVFISVVFTAAPGKLSTVKEIVTATAAKTRTLPGTIGWRVFTFQHDNADKILVVQEYNDMDSYKAFIASGLAQEAGKRFVAENLTSAIHWETYDELH